MKHCFFFLWDGASYSLFKALLEQGSLPNIQKYLLSSGEFKKIYTSFPSTTGPAYLPFLTGKTPGECNIPGIRWFDKEAYHLKKKRFSRSYVGYHSFSINHDITKNTKSLFHYFDHSFNLYNPISLGLSHSSKNKISWIKSIYSPTAHFSGRWLWVDQRISQSFLKSIPLKPTFVFCVFPGIDGTAHHFGLQSKKLKEAYRRADHYFGDILDKHIRLNDPHFENTLVIATSDHGLSDTHSHFDLSQFLEKQKQKVFYYPKIWRKKFQYSVMPSGNAMAHLYFTDRKERVFYETLADEHKWILQMLLEQDAVDWIAMKSKERGIVTLNYSEAPPSIDGRGQGGGWQSQYPDMDFQLSSLFQSPRCGDVVICAKKGFDLRDQFEFPKHKASHGSLIPEHMEIPLCSNKKLILEDVRSMNVFTEIIKNMV
ncbi:MAG: alkaline phosphatase family protein [Deltaproteobacteria bacterium]|nr:alkaline phosphatase family protein [Deltaproteobacteria bacterium]